MKNISPALQSFLLDNSEFGRADLIAIDLPNGTTLNVLSGNNTDITYLGTTYYCSRLGAWQRGAFKNSASFQITAGSMQLTAYIPESVSYPGTTTPLMQTVNAGMFNAAKVTIQTLYWPVPGPPSGGFSMGTMMLNVGQIGDVKPAGRSKVIFEIYDLTYLLNRPFPPFQIQSSCRHTLFDEGCTLLVSNFISTNVPLDTASTTLYLNLNAAARANSTVYASGAIINVSGVLYRCTTAGTSAGSAPTFNADRAALTTDGSVVWTSMNNAYPLGYVMFTSGQNSGLKASVKVQVNNSGVVQLQLIKPLPFPVSVGDNVQLVPGCDKTIPTCQNVYNNLIHFGGMPFVPNPEIAQ